MKKNLKSIIAILFTLIIGIACGASVDIAIRPSENKTEVKIDSGCSIELSEEQKPTIIEKEDGQLEEISAPTVEEIDGNQPLASEGDLPDLGQGAYYDISSPQAFRDATYGKCIDMDGYFGSQCVDLATAFWLSYAGRWPSVCGTGSAYGLWDCREQNAGVEFDLILDPTQVKTGDITVFGGGANGHVGVAMGPYNNGYVALLGENQGGTSCYGGGAATNIINMSTKTFLGAFRPKAYIVEEPKKEEVAPIPLTNCMDWQVEEGDTMLGIGLVCENVLMNMEQVNQYADTWESQIYNPGKTVYWGWTHGTGYGLFAGDYLLHDVEGR